jgi:hypothetical protein
MNILKNYIYKYKGNILKKVFFSKCVKIHSYFVGHYYCSLCKTQTVFLKKHFEIPTQFHFRPF